VASPLKIDLFGPMRVLVDGVTIPQMRSRKGQWLLALLVLRANKPVARDWLATQLWPDAEAATALANLRSVVSDLRKALGSQGERLKAPDRKTLIFDTQGAEIDAIEFDTAIKGRPGVLAATDLYVGPLLEGCSEEWVFQERSTRERDCLNALQALAEKALQDNDLPRAVGLYKKAVAIDPSRDAFRRGLMEALEGMGELNSALQEYRDFARQLKQGSSDVPDAQTTELYNRLRSGIRKGRRRSLQRDESNPFAQARNTFVGRADERIDIAERLRLGRLVTLTGIGGIGKSRLAANVANAVAGEYPGGIWFVALDSVTNPKAVVGTIANVLGIREQAGRALLADLATRFHDEKCLLLLDNCEHLLDGVAPLVQQLIRECPSLHILATSRESLGLPGEAIWPVATLLIPELTWLRVSGDALVSSAMSFEAMELFVLRARAAKPDFELSSLNVFDTAELCIRLEGIPLAIELAASQIRLASIKEILDRIGDLDFERSETGSTGVADRQRTMRATLDWSYELLSQDEQRAFRHFSVFADGWTLEAATHIAGDVVNILTSLVDKSLVTFDPRHGRYRMLEAVRQYASDKLSPEEAAEVQKAHRRWYLGLAETASLNLRGPNHRRWMQELLSDHDNLLVALDRPGSVHENQEEQWRFVNALVGFWQAKGFFEEALRYISRTLDEVGGAARARMLVGLGEIYISQSNFDLAKDTFSKSLALSRELNDAPRIVRSLSGLAKATHEQGDTSSASLLIDESLAIARQSDCPRELADTLHIKTDIVFAAGRRLEAEKSILESLSIYQGFGDEIGSALTLAYSSNFPLENPDHLLRHARCSQSISQFRALGDSHGVAYVAYTLARWCLQKGDVSEANDLYSEALGLFRTLGDRRGVVLSLVGVGRACAQEGDLARAKRLIDESLRICQELSGEGGCILSIEGMATVFLRMRQLEKATRLIAFSSALRNKIGSTTGPIDHARITLEIASLKAAMGEERFRAEWAIGSALPTASAFDLAFSS